MQTAPAERRRARPLAPDERREALVAATRPLLLAHGRATTTRMIAEAAGVAEGTVFGVFESKDELVEAVLAREFDPTHFLADLAEVGLDQPLRARLLAATTLLQRRFQAIFTMMSAMAMPRPPGPQPDERRALTDRGLLRLVEPDAERFRVPPAEVVRVLRLLTFSGSHPHISADQTLTPEQIVEVVLHGTTLPTPGDR